MGYLKDAILKIEEDKSTLKIDFGEAMAAIVTLQARKTFPQYRAARDKLYALAYESPAALIPLIAAYLDKIENDANARARTHMHLTNAVVVCWEEIRPEAAADAKEQARLEARKAEAFAVIARLAKEVPVGHVLNLMLAGDKGETEDAHLALGWLDHFQQPAGWVVLKALRMITEALERVRADAAMVPAQRMLYLVNGTSAISKLVRIHPEHPYVGDEVVRLLGALLGEEEDALRYNAGHVLAHVIRLAPVWPERIDFALFVKLLANLGDAAHPLGAEGAFDAIETMLGRHAGFDGAHAALFAGGLYALADASRTLGDRARRTLPRLLVDKRAELARMDACAQRLYDASPRDPGAVIRAVAPLANCGVREVEVAAVAAIRMLLDLAAPRLGGALDDETSRVLVRLDELGGGKPQEFRNEVELVLRNKAVKKALKSAPKAPAAARKPRSRPRTWSESIRLYLTENPIGEEIQSHLKLATLDLGSLLRKAADRTVGGLAVTALRDSYDSEFAGQFRVKDARIFTVALLRALSRQEDPPKVAAARDLLLRIEEDLLQTDRGSIWDEMCDEIGKALNARRAEFGPLAMKTLALLSGPPRENTAIVARVPDSIDLDGELAEAWIERTPAK